MAEARTLKLDFVVKKWQNQKIICGILIYAFCRFQNRKNPVGRVDTLILKLKLIKLKDCKFRSVAFIDSVFSFFHFMNFSDLKDVKRKYYMYTSVKEIQRNIIIESPFKNIFMVKFLVGFIRRKCN